MSLIFTKFSLDPFKSTPIFVLLYSISSLNQSSVFQCLALVSWNLSSQAFIFQHFIKIALLSWSLENSYVVKSNNSVCLYNYLSWSFPSLKNTFLHLVSRTTWASGFPPTTPATPYESPLPVTFHPLSLLRLESCGAQSFQLFYTYLHLTSLGCSVHLIALNTCVCWCLAFITRLPPKHQTFVLSHCAHSALDLCRTLAQVVRFSLLASFRSSRVSPSQWDLPRLYTIYIPSQLCCFLMLLYYQTCFILYLLIW